MGKRLAGILVAGLVCVAGCGGNDEVSFLGADGLPNTPPSVVSVTVSASLAFAGQTVSFTADARDTDGSIATVAWGFGDGQTATGVSVQHVYTQSGTYTVSISATDNRGATATAITAVTISDITVDRVTVTGTVLAQTSLVETAGTPVSVSTEGTWTHTVDYTGQPLTVELTAAAGLQCPESTVTVQVSEPKR